MREGLNGKAYSPWSESLTGMCRRGHILKETAPGAPVYYTYGAAGAANNGAGRIIAVDNGDVKETRKYGTLGEMTESTKIITSTSPTIKQTSYTTKYTWDSMGRLHRLVYPDGEILDYTYDNGGLLKKAVGTVGSGAISRAEGTIEYVKEILYDEFGQRTKMTLGNGDVTSYEYNLKNRRLTNLKTVGSDSTVWQNLEYTYDDVGNITKINNEDYITCDAKKKTTTQSYSYDDLDRLTEASGSYSHETWLPYYTDRINSYTSSFSYDSIGNILNKNQKNVGTYTDGSKKTLTDTTYDWDYKYTSTRPHAVTQTGTLFYTYDASGNMTKKTDTNTNASTVFTWNEENRLTQTVATTKSTTDTATTVFRYDDTGTRIAKKGANGETIYVNTNYSIKDEQLESTHIFAGQTRIATKLTMLTTKTTTTDMGVYYYHPDHIGSASTVTDSSGKFTEHCEYFPYGEVWISESASTSVTSLLPFKFTSKELDSETGLYYYGARYMDPKLGRFVSVDPILDEYLPNKFNDKNLVGHGRVFSPTNLNLFHYAANNPLRYIDPDGRYVESLWDIYCLGVSVTLFGSDCYKFATNDPETDIVDVLLSTGSTAVDTAALLLPGIPGGAGPALQASRLTRMFSKTVKSKTLPAAINGSTAAYDAYKDGSTAIGIGSSFAYGFGLTYASGKIGEKVDFGIRGLDLRSNVGSKAFPGVTAWAPKYGAGKITENAVGVASTKTSNFLHVGKSSTIYSPNQAASVYKK